MDSVKNLWIRALLRLRRGLNDLPCAKPRTKIIPVGTIFLPVTTAPAAGTGPASFASCRCPRGDGDHTVLVARPGGGLTGPDDGGVNHQSLRPLALRPRSHPFQERLEPTGVDPAAEGVVEGVPGPELARQVAPGDAGAGPIRDGLEGHAVGQLRLGVEGRAASLDHQTENGQISSVMMRRRRPRGRSALTPYRHGPDAVNRPSPLTRPS